MAKILGGGMFGPMSGKMGSMVFARNRGGAYVRSFVKPVDPKSIAQLQARSKFGISASNYHSLTPSVKAQWQNFASNTFNPQTGVMGVPSGFNAFVSLLNVIENFKSFDDVTYTMGSALVGTNNSFAPTFTPPAHALQGNFKGSDDLTYPYNFGSISSFQAEISGGWDFVFKINLSLNVLIPIGVTPGNMVGFKDAVDNEFGFVVYMSNPVDQSGMFIQNPMLQKLGAASGKKTITTPSAITTSLNLEIDGTLEYGKYNAVPVVGDWVQLTLFAISTNGMLLKVGSHMINVTAI